MKPLAIDLFCGLGGWTEGLLSEGFNVVGFDIERHHYGGAKYPAQLVIQDVLTIHGSQFKSASLIVASPPCQEFSYMAMPWSRAKNIAKEYRSGVRDVKQLTALFDACFRIQREASEAAGHHIPMVVENVRGAIPWVGRSRWNFGSFHLWGDVPALMPITYRAQKFNPDGTQHGPGSWFAIADSKNRGVKASGIDFNDFKNGKGPSPAFNGTNESRLREGLKNPGFRFDGNRSMQSESVDRHVKVPSESGRRTNVGNGVRFTSRDCGIEGTKQPGLSGPRTNGKGDGWFEKGAARHGSKSHARKAASAMIAKIPLVLSRHIARAWKPDTAMPRVEPLGQTTFWKSGEVSL